MLGDSPGVLSVLEKSAHHSRSKENLQARHSASFFPYKGYCASALAGLPPCCRRERLFSPLFPLLSLLMMLTAGRALGWVGVAKGCFLERSLGPAPWPKPGKKDRSKTRMGPEDWETHFCHNYGGTVRLSQQKKAPEDAGFGLQFFLRTLRRGYLVHKDN